MAFLPSDLRLAWRLVARERAVSIVAIGSLAIGIAANATVFSLLKAVLFPDLIYPAFSRLVFLESRHEARGLDGMLISAPDARDAAAGARTLTQVTIAAGQSSIIGEADARIRVGGRRVEPGFFELLGVRASLGRVLGPADGPGRLVLSDALWRRLFAADPSAVGRDVRLDGGTVTIVGVMPPGFDADADFWVPLGSSLAGFPRDDRQFMVFARLAPGADLEAATSELAGLSSRLAADMPATNEHWVMQPVPLSRLHGRDATETLMLLQGAVAIVLLIVCANIANVLLARGTRRRQEMALRLSLGASRRRLVGQLLTESLVLSGAGGLFGAMLTLWGLRLTRSLGAVPDVVEPSADVVVLGFTATLAMLTGVLCSLVPALRASKVAPNLALRAEAARRNGGASQRGHLQSALVALQVGAAVVLATGALLMLQTLAHRAQADLGFEPRGAVRADLAFSRPRYPDDEAVRAGVRALVETVESQPGVLAAGGVTWALPTAPGAVRAFTLAADSAGVPAGLVSARATGGVEAVTPGYFAAVGASMRGGRSFTARDDQGAEPVALVNQELADRLWPGRLPVGQRLRLGERDEPAPIVTVVGVVATMRRSPMHDRPIARAYVPFAQHPNGQLTIVARGRGAGGTAAVARDVRVAAARVDPELMVEGLRTVEEDVAQFVAPVRLVTTVLTAFGLTGVLLAALGVFGTMSYVVSQRQRELAIRSALGADRGRIVRLIVESGLGVSIIGCAAGVLVALIAMRALQGYLFGVEANDPLTLGVVAAGVMAAALTACLYPARFAARVEPMTVLRRD